MSRLRIVLLFAALTALAAADLVDRWPDPAGFPAGAATTFRTPAFSGSTAYPDKDPLYHVLAVPANYDPTRSYPLCIRFQPQGSKPWTGDMTSWFGKETFVLAVSWVQDAASDGRLTINETTTMLSSIHWIISTWNIDRSRIFVGGFSAGGWAASSLGMSPIFDRLSTHFVILGAGLRGDYRLPPQVGKPALVAHGSEDMNADAGKKAAAALTAAKLEVTHFIENGVGHSVGPQMKEQAATWYKTFDPAAHAADWIVEGEKLKADKATIAQGYARLGAVAGLGAGFPEAAKAREILDGGDLSEVRGILDQARQARGARDFHAMRHHSGLAFKAASKAKAPHLQLEAEGLMRDTWEWQTIAHQVEVKAAWDQGCPQEAFVLAQAGAGTYQKALADWADFADPYPNLIKRLQALTPPAVSKDEAKIQAKAAELRLKLWGDKYTNAKTLAKDRESFRAMLDGLGEGPTKTRGSVLVADLDRHGELMGFAAD